VSEPARPRAERRVKALLGALKRTVKDFKRDNLTIWAAALTYYSVLSLFPGLLVLVGVMGLLSDTFTATLLDNATPVVPPAVEDILRGAVSSVEQTQARPGLATVVGLLLAFWSASGYVSAFMKASNAIYGTADGRPFWKAIPLRVGVTFVTGLLAFAAAVIIVVSGRVAEVVGGALGFERETVKLWDVIKWPVLILIVSVMLAVLYWAGPNARLSGYRWIRPGGVIAVLLWIAVSLLFGLYVANFGSYNRTYGALAGVIIFLIWLWLTNLAILIGAKIDSESGETPTETEA
jgi:membrane protein